MILWHSLFEFIVFLIVVLFIQVELIIIHSYDQIPHKISLIYVALSQTIPL